MCYHNKIGGEKMAELSREENLVINLLSNSINEIDDTVDFSNVNFQNLFNISDKNAVNMIIFDRIKNLRSLIDDELYMKWLYFASRKLAIREEVLSTQKVLTSLLDSEGIKYFVFKGFCAACYYKRPELRETGDIDFYVDSADFEKTDKILKSNGFKLYNTSDDKHWSYTYGKTVLEMHYGFWDMPDNDCGNFATEYLKNSVNNRELYCIEDYSFFGPSATAHALILILHIVNHLKRGGIGLRHLYDFISFFASESFKNNKDDILTVLKKAGLFEFTAVISKISNDYFYNDDFDFYKKVDKNLSDNLLVDIVKSGNFGGLSEEVYYGSSVFTVDNSDKGSSFKSLISFCKTAWKPCEEHKILLILAPFYIGIRYFFRALSGKRPKINPVKFTKNGLDRAKLYKKLNLFKES